MAKIKSRRASKPARATKPKPSKLGAELLRVHARTQDAIRQGTDTPAKQKRLDRLVERESKIEQRIVARPTRSLTHAVDRAIVWLVNDDGGNDASHLAARGMAWHLLRSAGVNPEMCSAS
jgi:hypothetical protein